MKILKHISLSILFICLSGCWVKERGEKIGNIVKLGKQGLLIKTNEAELIRGGMNNANGSFGRPFDFTIEDESLLGKIQYALDNQKSVRIKYHKELATFFRTETDDNSFLDSVELVK